MFYYHKEVFKKFYVCCICVLLFSCANPKPPSGGPPDTTPTRIINFYPPNFSTNFQGDRLIISFNKWMDRGSVINNILINPPFSYEVDWSGKSLNIIFKDHLEQNTTYSFMLGSELSDLEGNRLETPFSLVFTRGNKIDSAKIIGKIIDQDFKNIIVCAIPQEKFSDSILGLENVFHYRTQPNSNGVFIFDALKDETYIIFAFRDQNNNKIFEEAFDFSGMTHKLFTATYQLLDTCFIALRPPKDTQNPSIIDIDIKSKNQIDLIFDKMIKIKSGALQHLKVVSIDGKDSSPYLAIVSGGLNKICKLYFKTPIDTGKFYLEIDNPGIFMDSIGNPLKYPNKLFFVNNRDLDRSNPQIVRPNASFQISSLSRKIIFEWSKPIDLFNLKRISALAIEKTTRDTIFLSIDIIDEIEFAIDAKYFRYGRSYQLEIKVDTLFDFLGNQFTNLINIFSIDVMQEPLYGSLQGSFRIRNDTSQRHFIAVLQNSSQMFLCPIKNGFWKFEQVPVGDYLFYIFDDKNGNGTYTYGQLFPLIFSEEIVKVIPKVQVQKGWTIEEINLWK